SFAILIPIFLASRITLDSDTGGWMDANNRRVLSRILHSFTVKFLSVTVILLSVPLLLYWQFIQTEQQQQKLLSSAINQTNQVIAAALAPHFAAFSHEPAGVLKDAMARVAVGN